MPLIPLMPTPPSYRSTVSALAVGQIVCWAALYYAFSSFVLPMQRALGWSKPELMGAFTVGLAMWGAASYAVGAAIDRGRGRKVMTLGAALAGVGFGLWSRVDNLPMLYLTWALLGVSMAMTLYEPAFNVLTKRFPDRYVRGITTLTLVGGFASTLSFPAAAWLMAWCGWRDALAVIGVVLLLVVAPLHAWALRGTPEHAAPPRAADARADRTAALLVFALLFGFANGLVTIVRGSLLPDYFGRQHVGRISGAMASIALLARAAAPLMTAWLLVALPGYRELLLGLSAVGVASLIAFALAERPLRGAAPAASGRSRASSESA